MRQVIDDADAGALQGGKPFGPHRAGKLDDVKAFAAAEALPFLRQFPRPTGGGVDGHIQVDDVELVGQLDTGNVSKGGSIVAAGAVELECPVVSHQLRPQAFSLRACAGSPGDELVTVRFSREVIRSGQLEAPPFAGVGRRGAADSYERQCRQSGQCRRCHESRQPPGALWTTLRGRRHSRFPFNQSGDGGVESSSRLGRR